MKTHCVRQGTPSFCHCEQHLAPHNMRHTQLRDSCCHTGSHSPLARSHPSRDPGPEHNRHFYELRRARTDSRSSPPEARTTPSRPSTTPTPTCSASRPHSPIPGPSSMERGRPLERQPRTQSRSRSTSRRAGDLFNPWRISSPTRVLNRLQIGRGDQPMWIHPDFY